MKQPWKVWVCESTRGEGKRIGQKGKCQRAALLVKWKTGRVSDGLGSPGRTGPGNCGGFHRIPELSQAHPSPPWSHCRISERLACKEKSGQKWKRKRKWDAEKYNGNIGPDGMAEWCGVHVLLQLDSLAGLKMGHHIEDVEPLQHWGAQGRRGRLLSYFNGELGRFILWGAV